MSDTKPLPSLPLSTLHIIGYLRWEREWYDSFEINRGRLLGQLVELLGKMSSAPNTGTTLRFFMLGGQTVIMEDIASVRPDLLALMSIYNGSGRLGLGPWYVTVDQRLVDGEALIRNLLMARADSLRYGIKVMPLGYIPDAGMHVAQLPQLLRGFGIGSAFLRYDSHTDTPFYWESPDGSNVMVLGHETPPAWNESTLNTISDSLEIQQFRREDGPFLWMLNYENTLASAEETLYTIEKHTGYASIQSDFGEYMRLLRRSIAGQHRALVAGDLKPATDFEFANGTLASRIYLKQENARLQGWLSHTVEPIVTLALTEGNTPFPENLQALLHHSWRQLLKNQAKPALGGISSDAVHLKNEQRFGEIEDTSKQLTFTALSSLAGRPHNPYTRQEEHQSHTVTYIVVWNGHNWTVDQVMEVPLRLPDGYYPARLRSHGMGDEQSEQEFSWEDNISSADPNISGTITFLAKAPALGYATYTVELSDQPLEAHFQARRVEGQVIGNVAGDTLRMENGQLIWTQANGREITDLLQFFDGGDAGDAYQYLAPSSDVIAQAQIVDDVHIVSSPVYERLVINHRMRIAVALESDRTRKRGLRLLELTTTATFYDHVDGVHLRTTFTNTAQDHRLRAHFKTGINSEHLLTNSVFAIRREEVGNTHAIQTLCAVQDQDNTLTLLTRGLPEVESIQEDNQVTLALTLARSIGWLNRDDIPERESSAILPIPVPQAQMEQREMSAEYALLASPPQNNADFIRASQAYRAPLQAFQYDTRPERPRKSYLSVVSDMSIGADSDGKGVIVTAFKPPMRGKGWIVRLFNPHDDRTVEVFITPHARPEQVYLVNLAEESVQFIETDGNGRILIQVEPHQLVTLKLVFEE